MLVLLSLNNYLKFIIMNTIDRNKGIDLIKIIAIITMVIDHLRYILPDYQLICIAFGRWAFIMFACAMAYNAVQIFDHKKYDSLKSYFKNLVIFAVISEIPYQLASQGQNLGTMNIMITLFFGLLIILAMNIKFHPLIKYITPASIIAFCYFINDRLQFGLLGVLLIVAYYLMFKNINSSLKYLFIPAVVVLAIACNAQYYMELISTLGFGSIWVYSMLIGCFSGVFASLLLSLGRIDLTPYKVNKIGKWAWWFYPVHLLIIGIIL